MQMKNLYSACDEESNNILLQTGDVPGLQCIPSVSWQVTVPILLKLKFYHYPTTTTTTTTTPRQSVPAVEKRPVSERQPMCLLRPAMQLVVPCPVRWLA